MPLVFQRILSCGLYACAGQTTKQPTGVGEYMNVNFVSFGEKCFSLMANLYDDYAIHKSIIDSHTFKLIVQVRLDE
jgi:hypothetical protein